MTTTDLRAILATPEIIELAWRTDCHRHEAAAHPPQNGTATMPLYDNDHQPRRHNLVQAVEKATDTLRAQRYWRLTPKQRYEVLAEMGALGREVANLLDELHISWDDMRSAGDSMEAQGAAIEAALTFPVQAALDDTARALRSKP